MENCIEKFKKKLVSNKIFFETLAALTVSIMAIIVSFEANSIAEISKDISYQNTLPDFDIVTINSNYDPIIKVYLEREVNIYNKGGKYSNLDTELITFYNLKFTDSIGKVIEIQIPLKNYLYVHFPGERENKMVRKVVGIQNQVKEDTLRFYIKRKIDQLKFNLIYAYTISYLKIEYLDLLEKKVTLFYDVTDYESRLLTIDGGKSVFEYYNQEITKSDYLDLNSLNPKSINNILEKFAPNNTLYNQ